MNDERDSLTSTLRQVDTQLKSTNQSFSDLFKTFCFI